MKLSLHPRAAHRSVGLHHLIRSRLLGLEGSPVAPSPAHGVAPGGQALVLPGRWPSPRPMHRSVSGPAS